MNYHEFLINNYWTIFGWHHFIYVIKMENFQLKLKNLCLN